jgi:hypothetical protein
MEVGMNEFLRTMTGCAGITGFTISGEVQRMSAARERAAGRRPEPGLTIKENGMRQSSLFKDDVQLPSDGRLAEMISKCHT